MKNVTIVEVQNLFKEIFGINYQKKVENLELINMLVITKIWKNQEHIYNSLKELDMIALIWDRCVRSVELKEEKLKVTNIQKIVLINE